MKWKTHEVVDASGSRVNKEALKRALDLKETKQSSVDILDEMLESHGPAYCKHKKVFSSSVLCSYPAKYPWICSKCGLEGVDQGTLPQGETYDDVRKRFNK